MAGVACCPSVDFTDLPLRPVLLCIHHISVIQPVPETDRRVSRPIESKRCRVGTVRGCNGFNGPARTNPFTVHDLPRISVVVTDPGSTGPVDEEGGVCPVPGTLPGRVDSRNLPLARSN